ncbi:hypothetical protein D5055_10150 [Acinetobacter radioresistens]|nr:hypothetical protein D5055_10150 [Acinetobacter radioresistens]
MINNLPISKDYILAKFKKDFPQSEKGIKTTGIGTVILLTSANLKAYLKHPDEYVPPYFPYLDFTFKNGRLHAIDIRQGITC